MKQLKWMIKLKEMRPREHNSVGRDMYYYMQMLGFERQTPHLFTLKKVNYNY